MTRSVWLSPALLLPVLLSGTAVASPLRNADICEASIRPVRELSINEIRALTDQSTVSDVTGLFVSARLFDKEIIPQAVAFLIVTNGDIDDMPMGYLLVGGFEMQLSDLHIDIREERLTAWGRGRINNVSCTFNAGADIVMIPRN